MLKRLTLVAALIAGVLTIATAQAQPVPPHRFFGTLTIDAAPAPAGTDLRAFVGTTECGQFTTTQAGLYAIDALSTTQRPGCGRGGGDTVAFRVGDRTAQQMPEFRTGGFEPLNLTIGGAAPSPSPSPTPSPSPAPTPTPAPSPSPPPRFNAATLDLSDPRPCIPAPGSSACDAARNGLWNGDPVVWARDRGVTDPDQVFLETVIFRVRAADPAVISIIARLLNAPYLQVTFVKFLGTQPGQTDEFVEVSNLGGGDQEMTGWIVRSPQTDQVFRFPDGFMMRGGDKCRVYTGAPQADSCGGTSFNSTNVWDDNAGQVILFYEALQLAGAEPRYSADPTAQPPPPNLKGLNAS